MKLKAVESLWKRRILSRLLPPTPQPIVDRVRAQMKSENKSVK